MSARDVAAALDRLREVAALLRLRTAESVLDALAHVLESWRDPASPWRCTLEAELPEAAGFSPAVVRLGLGLALEEWTGDALRSLAARELPALLAGALDRKELVSGFPTTALLCAGAIPMPTLLGVLAPLLLRSPVLVKPSAHDPLTPRLVAQSLAARDPLLGACVAVVPFASGDDAALGAFLAADCVVAMGSDETVAAVAARVAPPRRLVTYGHRVSIAALGPGATTDSDLVANARGLARDVALWDQLGCLSPVSVYVVGAGRSGAERVAGALADALASLERDLPRGRVAVGAAAAFAHARGEAEMRAAAGRAVRVLGARGDAFCVVLEDDATPRAAPLHRFVRVHPVADDERFVVAMQPLAPHLAAVATAGFGADASRVTRALAELGASRVCRPGRMQAPPLGWHHDNQGVLSPLARFTDAEDV